MGYACVPAQSATAVAVAAEGSPTPASIAAIGSADGGGFRLENRHLVAVLGARLVQSRIFVMSSRKNTDADGGRWPSGADGTLRSLICKPPAAAADSMRPREAIAPGALANRFVLFEDLPFYWDAWDVEVYHLEKKRYVEGAATARIIEAGPLRVAVEFTVALSPRSKLAQVVSLSAVSRRLDFDTSVSWHESHTFLKVECVLQFVKIVICCCFGCYCSGGSSNRKMVVMVQISFGRAIDECDLRNAIWPPRASSPSEHELGYGKVRSLRAQMARL
jgi:hypothetical protein